MAANGPVRAFLSYAHEDSEWCEAVLRHIGWLRHSGQIAAFHDRELKPGERWNERIRGELATSEIVVALVSPYFMDSRYCCLDELQPAIVRSDRGESDLVPIVCDFVELGPLSPYQCLPQDENNNIKPLSDWPNPNLPLAKFAAKVRALVEARRPAPVVAPSQPAPAPAPTPPAGPSLAERLAAAVAGRIGGMLEGMLRTTLGTRATLPPPAPRAPAPAAPQAPETEPSAASEPFLGRQTDLDQLVLWLLDQVPQPIAVLGPGGIGKTTLTRAALRDLRFADRFAEPGRRLFVPLEEVRDATGLYRAIGRTLALPDGDRPAEAALAALATAPTLLVLDNAETPWEADPAEVEPAFARLAAVRAIGLVASFRGFELPGGADWRPLIVEPLVPDAARALFLDIAGDRFAADPALPTLLARLDGLPLAIELVAHRAREEPDIAAVLRRWEAERTAFLQRGEGGRKDLDLAVSIALSLSSPRMTHPGRRLFALLGRLPQGLARVDLAAVMPEEGASAVEALTRTGLTLRDPERLRLLAPVREYAAEQDLPEREAAALASHFGALADALPWETMEPADPAAAARARHELANIEAVLVERDAMADPATLARRAAQWIGVGDARRTLGNVTLAEQAYLHYRSVNSALASREPENPQWQRDLSVSWEKLGGVRQAQGDLPGALDAYTQDMQITAKLAAADPGNAGWQRDLSVSWNMLGGVRAAQGDLPGALDAYTQSQTIRAKLAAADPGNAGGQRDLSVSWQRLGGVREAQGDLPGALDAYTQDMQITAKLAAADPGNAGWQRDLSVSWNKLGGVREAQGDLPGALDAYTQSQTIRAKLAAADPGNAGWQRDLSVSWEKLGGVREAQGDLPGALDAYTQSQTIRARLAAADPGNAGWQRDLSVSWEKLGGVREAQGDLPGALDAYTASQTIRAKLAAADPGNAQWQRDLIVSHWKLAALLERMPGPAAEAVGHWSQALAIARTLADTGRLAPTDAYFVDTLQQRLAAATSGAATASLRSSAPQAPNPPARLPPAV